MLSLRAKRSGTARLTAEDMDRLLAFYVRVFDAEVTLDMTEKGLRHAFFTVGPATVLTRSRSSTDRRHRRLGVPGGLAAFARGS
jgi:uncharacterized glyoxalase superfamily protein PhnB